MPRNRLPKEVEQEIMRLRLKGSTRDEIAKRLGISAGKVSTVLSDFDRISKRDGMNVTARNYDVEGDVGSLVNLAVQLRKSGVTVAEASGGARIMGKLRNLSVDEEDFEGFITQVYLASKEAVLTPKNVVGSATELFRLREETGLEYHELIARCGAASEEKTKLEDDIRKLKKEKEDALGEKKATIELLNEYVKLRDSLKGYGLDVKGLPRLKALLENAEELGYETKAVIEGLSKVESLTEKKRELEKEVKELEEKANSLSRKAEEAQSSIREKEPTIEVIKTLESLGFDTAKLETLNHTVKEIMSHRGYKPDKAVEKFFQDLRDYDGKLGFEQDLKKLETEIENTKTELNRQQTGLKALKAEYADFSSTINSIQELSRKRVSPEQIISWRKIVAESGCQPEELQKWLEDYAGIQKLITSKKKALEELEETTTKRKAELEELSRKKSSIEASIKTVEDACIQELKDLKGKIASELKGLGDEALSDVEKVTTEAEGKLSKTYSGIEETSKKAQVAFEGYSEKLDDLLENAIETGKKVEELKAFGPLLSFVTSGEGEPTKVHPVVLRVIEKYSAWMERHPSPESQKFKEYVDSLIKFMRTRIVNE
jgi:chromosome segregation ATPase